MSNSFVRVPPDSTGKRLFTQQHNVDGVDVQGQVFHLADPNSPNHIQRISYSGAAAVGFSEGEPSLDAFGNLRIGQAMALGYYDNVSGSQDDLYWHDMVGSGIHEYNSEGSYVVLRVGADAGAKAHRSTNRYHYYQPGVGILVLQTLSLGDTGKEGNFRRWGIGDDKNGIYWELEGSWDPVNQDKFHVVIKSTASGVTTYTKISRKDWNGDRIDGFGKSGFTLNLTGRMYYWIDYAWLGVGTVRMGVVGDNGERITCHTFQNPGDSIALPYTQSGSMPLMFENENVALTSGTSEMRLFCSAVYAEQKLDYNYYRFCDIENSPKVVTTNTPLCSLRPKLTFAGKTNRTNIYPERLSLFVTGGAIKLQIVDNADLTGATWSISGGGCTEGDNSASSATGGDVFQTYYLDEGCHNIDISHQYEYNDEGYLLHGNGIDQMSMTLVATKMSGTTVQVASTINYRELR